jgi:hypothetical protein
VALLVVLLNATFAATLFAAPTDEEEAQGRDYAQQAMTEYNDGDYNDAIVLFDKARAIYPAAQVLRMTGYTLMALGRWLEAADALEEAISTEYKPMVPRDIEHAQDNFNEVLKHIVVVEVRSSVTGALVSVDGSAETPAPHKVRLLPGVHALVVTAPRHKSVEKEIDVAAGESADYELNPEPLASPNPRPMPRPKPTVPKERPNTDDGSFGWFPGQGIVGLTVGGVGLAAGLVGLGVGGYGTSLRGAVQDNIDAHHQNYDDNCSRNRDLCLTDIELINRDGQRSHDLQTTGLVLGISGATLFAVGTTLFLLSDMSPFAPSGDDAASASASARCGITVGGVGCAGSF